VQLFISYSHSNIENVIELVDTLRDGGYSPWFDDQLIPGKDWKNQISESIQKCDAFIFLLSKSSVTSDWCLWELKQASEFNKPTTNLDISKWFL